MTDPSAPASGPECLAAYGYGEVELPEALRRMRQIGVIDDAFTDIALACCEHAYPYRVIRPHPALR